MALQNDIDDYIDMLINSQYGPIKHRVVGALSSSFWLYKDVGICSDMEKSSCPQSVKQMAARIMDSNDIVLWPLFIPCNLGHWVLAVIYTKSHHVALIDSSIDKQDHAKMFPVRRTSTYYLCKPYCL